MDEQGWTTQTSQKKDDISFGRKSQNVWMNTHKIYGHMEAVFVFVTVNCWKLGKETVSLQEAKRHEGEYKLKMLKNVYGYLYITVTLSSSFYSLCGKWYFVYIRVWDAAMPTKALNA